MPIDRATTPYEMPTDRDFLEVDFENVDLEDSIPWEDDKFLLDNAFD